MFNPDAILTQVLDGSIPDTWHVFKGHGRSFWLALLSGITAFIAVCIVLLALLLCLGPISELSWLIAANSPIANEIKSTPQPLDYHQFMPLLQNLSVYFWILPILCALIFMVIAYRRGQAFSHALLILTPEGVVQCHNYAAGRKRELNVLDFEQVTSLTLHLHSNDDSSHALVWLDVVRRADNATEKWPIDSRYGSVEQILQTIIEDHALYVARGQQQTI